MQYNYTVLFVLGTAGNDRLRQRVRDEQKMHHDILQLRIPDTYDNIVYKVAGAVHLGQGAHSVF